MLAAVRGFKKQRFLPRCLKLSFSRCTVVQCNVKLADDINLSPNLNVFTDKYDGGCKYAVMVVVDEIPSSV